MTNIEIFRKHFIRGMIVKDFGAFQSTHPTLLKCILNAMNEITFDCDERILCAAIWYDDGKEYRMQPINISSGIVVSGHRHPHCKVILMTMFYPNWQTDTLQEQIKNTVNNKEVQGFLTSNNRFITREEAVKLWKRCGKEPMFHSDSLFSEDLY